MQGSRFTYTRQALQMEPTFIRSLKVMGPDETIRDGDLFQHYHFAEASRDTPAGYVRSDGIRLRMEGFPVGLQDRRNEDAFVVPGVGTFTIQH